MNTATEDATETASSLGLVPRSLAAKTSRTDHLESLVQSLDDTIFVVLGTLYFYDNFTLLFGLRIACQLLYASSQFSPTIVANLVCIATHIIHSRPTGAKATRGYLHGGLIVDFIGELGPTSRFKLLLLDGLILTLQLIFLAISHELQAIRDAEAGVTKIPPQDVEAEEAGVRKGDQELDSIQADEDGIELQPMLPGSSSISYKPAVGEMPDEDLILRLNIRRSLASAIRKSAETSPESGANAGRIGVLLDRISSGRPAAART